MGLFSWECRKCSLSILHPGICNGTNSWLSKAVALFPNGTTLIGEYDGYGRINGANLFELISLEEDPCIYHLSCWQLTGRPAFDGPSKPAEDQGHFIQPDRYSVPDPLLTAPQTRGKNAAPN